MKRWRVTIASLALAVGAAVAAAQTVWRFEATDGDGKQGGYAVGKSANKTPKTGDTSVLTLPGGEKMVENMLEKINIGGEKFDIIITSLTKNTSKDQSK